MAKISPSEKCPCGSGLVFGECHGPRVKGLHPPEIKNRIKLKVISKPAYKSRSIFEHIGEGSLFFQGFETDLAWVCGSCESPLVAGLQPGQVTNVVLRCSKCKSFNEI